MTSAQWWLTRKGLASGFLTLVAVCCVITSYTIIASTRMECELQQRQPRHAPETLEPDLSTMSMEFIAVKRPSDDTGARILRQLAAARNAYAEERLKSMSPTMDFRYIIIVQVHDRAMNLRALLGSLAVVGGIDDACVILSHDVIEEKIDSIALEKERSFEVVQIYFPNSTQLYNDEFPGSSVMDCVGNVSEAKFNCTSYDHPDTYGKYRNPKFTQAKHHWWWKFQFVFNKVPFARTNIPVIFLEEDHYVFPDALSVLDHLLKYRHGACSPNCSILSIGHHNSKLAEREGAYQEYYVQKWTGENMGTVFDYDHYLRINDCAFAFCTIDDYNWDWTLRFLAADCLKDEHEIIIPVASRVVHTGACSGMHHTTPCNPDEYLKETIALVEKQKHKLFPRLLKKTTVPPQPRGKAKVNGGWGDPRDHELCIDNTQRFIPTLDD